MRMVVPDPWWVISCMIGIFIGCLVSLAGLTIANAWVLGGGMTICAVSVIAAGKVMR